MLSNYHDAKQGREFGTIPSSSRPMGYVEGIMSWPLLLMVTIHRNTGKKLGDIEFIIAMYLHGWQERKLSSPIRL